MGAIFTPHVIPGLRLSLDYTSIEKTNEIRTIMVTRRFSSWKILCPAASRAIRWRLPMLYWATPAAHHSN